MFMSRAREPHHRNTQPPTDVGGGFDSPKYFSIHKRKLTAHDTYRMPLTSNCHVPQARRTDVLSVLLSY
jgi:hypothetical protein